MNEFISELLSKSSKCVYWIEISGTSKIIKKRITLKIIPILPTHQSLSSIKVGTSFLSLPYNLIKILWAKMENKDIKK